LQRDEEKVKQQRLAISSKYGLKTMMNNLLEIYSRHGVKVDS
jgi:hypothetical protein